MLEAFIENLTLPLTHPNPNQVPAMLDAFIERMLPKIIETEHKGPGGRDELLSALSLLTAEVQRLSELAGRSAKVAERDRTDRVNKVLLALFLAFTTALSLHS